MVERRKQRMQAIATEYPEQECVKLARDKHCSRAIVGWGRSASAALEATQLLGTQGWEFAAFFPRLLWPLPVAAFEQLIESGVRVLFVCETNTSGQLAHVIRSQLSRALVDHGVEVVSITRDDGLALTPHEIQQAILAHPSLTTKNRSATGSERGEMPLVSRPSEIPC
jgi:pyruvate/2-oxoacid:ferredoxin oxidoreductase alpha subunit